MPIVINTTEQSCENRVTRPPMPLWLPQSLTRFMSNHKGRVYTNLEFEDTHAPGNSLSNTIAARGANLAVTISSSEPVNRLKRENMLRNLKAIRLKWDMILNTSLNEYAGLIMVATQSNLIGLPVMSRLASHPQDRTMQKAHIRDKSNILAPQEADAVLQGISNRSGNEVQVGSFLETGLTQITNDQNPTILLNRFPDSPCGNRGALIKKNFRYPSILHSCQSNKDYAGNPSFYRTLYTFCTTFAARLSNLNIGFRQYLESVAHSWEQFLRFLEHTSSRGGNVIYLLSRTTMRRVKFLYEKPPTTVTV
jgi:hypothetical protein